MILQDTSATQPRVGSINDLDSCREAARLIKEGYPVGGFVRSTCGIWVDADNPRGVEAILRIKGPKRTGRPISTMLYADDLLELIDFESIRPDLRPMFQDAGELASRLATLCFMRVPVTESAVRRLPEVVLSVTPDGIRWVQNYIPGKSSPGFPLVDAMLEAGIRIPSATSMNVSGEPEIVDQQDALEFCAAQGISLFLADPGVEPVAKGSYPIISAGPEGVKLLREGHFPGYLFRYLLQTDVDTSGAAPAKFPVYLTHCERCASGMEPHELHDEIVALLEGKTL